jgi:hypothetical protein
MEFSDLIILILLVLAGIALISGIVKILPKKKVPDRREGRRKFIIHSNPQRITGIQGPNRITFKPPQPAQRPRQNANNSGSRFGIKDRGIATHCPRCKTENRIEQTQRGHNHCLTCGHVWR